MKRDWHTYFVRPTFAEHKGEAWPELPKSEIETHRSNLQSEWETHVLRLPAPIVAFAADFSRIREVTLFGSKVRLYPPFPIDRRGETSGAFKDWWIPEGESTVDIFKRLPGYAVPGVVTENVPVPGAKYCQGLRIDAATAGPIELHRIVQGLMEQVCQHTHQWWLRGRTSPFSGIRRLECEVNRDFTFAELFRYRGAGELHSPWRAVIETQVPLGIELPLTEQVWHRCIDQLALGLRGDVGLLAFHDAISYYMDADDVLSITSMTICVEVLGNKRRLLNGKKPTGFGELIRTSDLIDKTIEKTIGDLFVDRGHVAHGRRPPRSQGDADRLFNYLVAVEKVVASYMGKLTPDDWVRASKLEVSRGAA